MNAADQAMNALDLTTAIETARDIAHDIDESTPVYAAALRELCAETERLRASRDAQWEFVLDDAAYEVGRGVRALALPECETRAPADEIAVRIRASSEAHGVVIRVIAGLDPGLTTFEIARAQVVFDVLDAVRTFAAPRLEDAITGLLLGYDALEVQRYCDRSRG